MADFYGVEQEFFYKYNKVNSIKNVVIIYHNNFPIGCGGIKENSSSVMEIKRMFLKESYRGQGITSKILLSLENWARDLGYNSTILETLKVKESVTSMYSKNGYELMPNYGQYENIESSVCMKKDLH